MALTPNQSYELRRSRIGHSGNRLRRAIELADVTQTDLAKAIGLTYTYVADVTRGRYQTITVENAHKFADYFGVHIEDLFPSKDAVSA